ncbi:hypothetical protein Q5H93_15050 [Hymenobacter sp. ASUV-10]|uniref:Lipoprotein n=1 Tax=Hymenobacter aranciens TaxID=3063996 RepID=A0ABT9BCR6_9BACT|nr:hypothetical protein [Hymenobacter sp. ASUV-10]MDO7876060.1 hypothetical protein [Hymenobacter sp. ASUV-10]
MKPLAHLLTSSFLIGFVSACEPGAEKSTISKVTPTEVYQVAALSKALPYDTLRLQQESFGGNSILFYLRHPQIPQVAKDLYLGHAEPSDDDKTLALMDSIFTKNTVTQPFYFLTLTRTMPKADGAYSEPLGIMAKEFVEQHPSRFAAYFLTEKLLTKKDFGNWAERVAMEFDISNEGHAASARAAWAKAQLNNCKSGSTAEESKLREFTELVNGWHQPD